MCSLSLPPRRKPTLSISWERHRDFKTEANCCRSVDVVSGIRPTPDGSVEQRTKKALSGQGSLARQDTWKGIVMEKRVLTTFRVFLDNGTDYVTNMAKGITLAEAQAYFAQGPIEIKEGVTCRVIRVEQLPDLDT